MKAPIGGRRLASFGRRLWEQGGLLQLRPAAGEREQLVGGGRAPFRWHCLGDLRFLRWRSHEAGGRLGGHGLGFGLGLVHHLARGRGGPATPVQLVLWLPGPSRVPALATIDDALGPVVAVAGNALWFALDAVAAARDVNQRARNQHREQSPGADHRQPAGIYCHSLVCMRRPAARRAYTGGILTRNHVADAAASAAPKINNK